MGRLAKGFAGLGVVLLCAYLVGSVDWREARSGGLRPVDPPVAGDGPLEVGGAEEPITPQSPTPLGGFARRRGALHQGVLDPVFARALVVTGLEGQALAIVNLDLVLIPPAVAEAIRAGVRAEGIDAVLVTATHTHNGPGAIWDNRLAERVGLGPFDAAMQERVVNGAIQAVVDARAAAQPALMHIGHGEGPAVCRSRIDGRHPDRRLTVVSFRRLEGDPIGQLVVFPCHPTLLGPDDLRLSAGWPGVVADQLQGITLVLQGAVGDVTHMGTGLAREAQMQGMGKSIAGAVRSMPLHPVTQRFFYRTVVLDLPRATAETFAPEGTVNLASNVIDHFAPHTARVSWLEFGDTAFAFVPGEPVTPLVSRWERTLGASVRVVGLTDGYLGYFETPEAFAARAGESHRAYFGADTVTLIERALGVLATGG